MDVSYKFGGLSLEQYEVLGQCIVQAIDEVMKNEVFAGADVEWVYTTNIIPAQKENE